MYKTIKIEEDENIEDASIGVFNYCFHCTHQITCGFLVRVTAAIANVLSSDQRFDTENNSRFQNV